ncbi:MAG: SseB family protein [Lapillicoccus sp.]
MTADSRDPADTARTPWAGRRLSDTGFGSDDGSADPALLELLLARQSQPSADVDRDLVALAARARWIVPVVAAPAIPAPVDPPTGPSTDASTGPSTGASSGASSGPSTDASSGAGIGAHSGGDAGADMAVVTLTSPDGRRALPVFTSTAALARWEPSARPVPVEAARAAQAAVAEGCDLLVVDVGSPYACELRPSMVWALAHQQPWLPAHEDPFVARSVAAAVVDEEVVLHHRLDEGLPTGTGVLRVVLVLVDGLDASSVQALATRVGERLASDGELRARVDDLAFTIEGAP